MAISKMLFFLYFFLTHLTFVTLSQPDFFFHECSNEANYTHNSIFQKNLHNVLSSISSDTQIDYGYYNISYGEDPDKVNVIALCRATELGECRSCVNNATQKILQVCPNQKEGMGWYSTCQIRYSNNSIFGVPDNSIKQVLYNINNASDAKGFNQALRSLLDQLRIEAKSGNSIRKFAVGDKEAPDPSFDTIYSFVECNPDLSSLDCDTCLTLLARHIPECCNASIGARLVAVTCQLDFEIHPFNNPIPSPPSPSPLPPSPRPATEHASPPPSTGGIIKRTTIITIIVVSTSSATVLMIAICIILRMRKQRHHKPLEIVENEISSIEMLQFDFNTIKLATNDFSNENKLGQGGFGSVYKGKLSNGQNIAVKRLAKDSHQGDSEFRNEVLLMVKLRHRNLVSLLGFCLEGHERLLIYEFVPNGSLDQFLFDLSKRIHLDWIRRYRIIVGIARGLLYLHEDSQLRIVHRDLKASNILLDEEMNAKIADFGMARLFELDETRGETSRIVGTFGYMAPEYVLHGRYSTKSDVFSFGIIILEILTGKKVHHFYDGENNPVDLLSFAWNKWKEGNGLDIIDSTLGSNSGNEMVKWIHIGLLCVQENVEARPSIASVIVMLSTNSNSVTLPIPSKPAFSSTVCFDDESNSQHRSSGNGTTTRSVNSTTTPSSQYSENTASITDLYPR